MLSEKFVREQVKQFERALRSRGTQEEIITECIACFLRGAGIERKPLGAVIVALQHAVTPDPMSEAVGFDCYEDLDAVALRMGWPSAGAVADEAARRCTARWAHFNVPA